MAVLAGEAIIHIKVNGASGKGELTDKDGNPLSPPPPDLTPAEHKRVYDANGFKLVGSLYHSHSSPGCLYWIGNTPVILPCP